MKNINLQNKQKGFFSVGIAAIVLLVSGGVAAVSDSESSEDVDANVSHEQVQPISEGEFKHSRAMTPNEVMGLDNLHAL